MTASCQQLSLKGNITYFTMAYKKERDVPILQMGEKSALDLIHQPDPQHNLLFITPSVALCRRAITEGHYC